MTRFLTLILLSLLVATAGAQIPPDLTALDDTLLPPQTWFVAVEAPDQRAWVSNELAAVVDIRVLPDSDIVTNDQTRLDQITLMFGDTFEKSSEVTDARCALDAGTLYTYKLVQDGTPKLGRFWVAPAEPSGAVVGLLIFLDEPATLLNGYLTRIFPETAACDLPVTDVVSDLTALADGLLDEAWTQQRAFERLDEAGVVSWSNCCASTTMQIERLYFPGGVDDQTVTTLDEAFFEGLNREYSNRDVSVDCTTPDGVRRLVQKGTFDGTDYVLLNGFIPDGADHLRLVFVGVPSNAYAETAPIFEALVPACGG